MFDLVCETLRDSAARRMLPFHLATQPLTPDMRLTDLGIDSLASMVLMSEIGGRLSVSMANLEFDHQQTLGDIATTLSDALLVQSPE